MRIARCLALVLLSFALPPLSGCTLFPDKQPATLDMTTSAERVNQIFYENVSAGRWETVASLISANAVWHAPKKTLRGRDEIVAYLKSAAIAGAQVSAPELHANLDSITVLYTLQWNAGGSTVTRRMATVWQHVPGKKANSPYLMTFSSEALPE